MLKFGFILELDVGGADLIRRAVKYYINIMPFREFLELNLNYEYASIKKLRL